ncbi:hypothetical protein RRG08_000584 [Elysia crispata]|uniref:Uncharacterized protein n=1 Tax=Elysia crispata TaxID=231223 RepID=A0AAE0Y9X8_9GAST|nr:hypothetical protein RRG08_000584 [Elysia crispata]
MSLGSAVPSQLNEHLSASHCWDRLPWPSRSELCRLTVHRTTDSVTGWLAGCVERLAQPPQQLERNQVIFGKFDLKAVFFSVELSAQMSSLFDGSYVIFTQSSIAVKI